MTDTAGPPRPSSRVRIVSPQKPSRMHSTRELPRNGFQTSKKRGKILRAPVSARAHYRRVDPCMIAQFLYTWVSTVETAGEEHLAVPAICRREEAMADKSTLLTGDPVDEVITARVAAIEKGVHPVSVYRAIKEGRLKSRRSG